MAPRPKSAKKLAFEAQIAAAMKAGREGKPPPPAAVQKIKEGWSTHEDSPAAKWASNELGEKTQPSFADAMNAKVKAATATSDAHYQSEKGMPSAADAHARAAEAHREAAEIIGKRGGDVSEHKFQAEKHHEKFIEGTAQKVAEKSWQKPPPAPTVTPGDANKLSVAAGAKSFKADGARTAADHAAAAAAHNEAANAHGATGNRPREAEHANKAFIHEAEASKGSEGAAKTRASHAASAAAESGKGSHEEAAKAHADAAEHHSKAGNKQHAAMHEEKAKKHREAAAKKQGPGIHHGDDGRFTSGGG